MARVPAASRQRGEPVVHVQHVKQDDGAPFLRVRDVDELIVARMMSSMCVHATVRAAADQGFAVTVAHDACGCAQRGFGDLRGGTRVGDTGSRFHRGFWNDNRWLSESV